MNILIGFVTFIWIFFSVIAEIESILSSEQCHIILLINNEIYFLNILSSLDNF